MIVEEIQLEAWMRRAMELAERGRGYVEPNPMVGCLITKNNQVIGEGFHQKFGEAHAEVNALNQCAESALGATAIVTLEPCCHTGKTPPCADALIQAGIKHVVIGTQDPFPRVDGGGIEKLKAAGIEVQVGVLESEIRRQNAGFLKKVRTGRPWVIAKWAMTLDGNIATSTGDSQWISNESSRQKVHELRGKVDAIFTGSGTVKADDPLLTARPAGPRIATRILFDSNLQIPLDSKLCRSIQDAPLLLVAKVAESNSVKAEQLEELGSEVIFTKKDYVERVDEILSQLGNRGMTNVLLEGGSGLVGEFLQADAIDEVHVYVAPTMTGKGIAPVTGFQIESMKDRINLQDVSIEIIESNVLFRGLIHMP